MTRPAGQPARHTGSGAARPRRRSPGWVPNQHGAWAMLISPFVVGVLAGGVDVVHVPLAAFWLAGYFAFFATSVWLKSGRRPRFWPPVRAYAALAAGLGVLVLALRPELAWWAPWFVVPLGVGLWAAAHRQERAMLAGLATVAGSSLMTVVAHAAGSGAPDRRAWLLAGVQFLYFAGTVWYVKSMIRERDNSRFRWASVSFHALATVVVAGVPTCVVGPSPWPGSWWLVGVFAALTVRAWWVPRLGLRPAQIGVGEIVSTVAVALVSWWQIAC